MISPGYHVRIEHSHSVASDARIGRAATHRSQQIPRVVEDGTREKRACVPRASSRVMGTNIAGLSTSKWPAGGGAEITARAFCKDRFCCEVLPTC